MLSSLDTPTTPLAFGVSHWMGRSIFDSLFPGLSAPPIGVMKMLLVFSPLGARVVLTGGVSHVGRSEPEGKAVPWDCLRFIYCVAVQITHMSSNPWAILDQQ